ncbi:MAG: UDP-N-acetylmuramate--L-alanine ligase [Flavobacteriales bacterium]|nr:UDP-N-acetylmuramate--L-alanine ligase [Flavobacteriales bacterium]
MTSKKNIYFIGVGGIGMSALARYFQAKGFKVGGYDKTETVLTQKLSEEGIEIHYEDDLHQVNEVFKQVEDTLVIITPAIPENHSEWHFFKDNGFEILKRAQVLGRITESNKSIGVAGTHGKTTISSMIAHLFKFCKVPFTAFLGGISKDLQSNYYHDVNSEITVIEADEYDRSFLHLKPEIATISAIDPDHLDIYGTKEEMEKTFKKYLKENLVKDGIGIIHHSLKSVLGSGYKTYSIEDDLADFFADNFRVENAEFIADFKWEGNVLNDVKIGLPGIHNMENSLVAFAVGIQKGINPELLKEALLNYGGVDRRFDLHIKSDRIVYIDDYAHHPEEINKLVASVRKMFPGKKILGIFQPHLFSRTQDFANEFARSLEELDELLLLDIYPARELPILGVNSQMLLDLINMNSKMLCSKKELEPHLKQSDSYVVLSIGAGDIGAEVENIKKYLLK